jgi:hypothetical protein
MAKESSPTQWRQVKEWGNDEVLTFFNPPCCKSIMQAIVQERRARLGFKGAPSTMPTTSNAFNSLCPIISFFLSHLFQISFNLLEIVGSQLA